MSINRKQTATAVILREELWSLRREGRYFTFCCICLCVVSGSLFAMSEEKSMLTKKIALGIARLLFILPEKAGVVCKHEAFRGWQYFLFVLLFPRILSHVWKYMLLYRLQEAAVHKWHQNNTERISNPFLSSSIDLIGLPWVCFIYAIMSLAALGFVVVFIPETKGCSLEQISMELAKT